MNLIRVLHLASFDGNVGDNANHSGFYRHFLKDPDFHFEIDQLEIREFYWRKRFFDLKFVNLANSYDLLIIGGGNYFELWVEHSPTGTSIMIEPHLFNQIIIPVLFNALGIDPAQGASVESCNKFRRFLKLALNNKKNFISIRNDGSLEALETFIGKEFAHQVSWTPDAGIYTEIDENFRLLPKKLSYVAINIAGDMLEKRFPGNGTYINKNEFKENFAEFVIEILNKKIFDEILFIPHIYKDLVFINSIISLIPDEIVRSKISVAPLLHGQGSEKIIFALYKHAKLSLSMRFHANICSIGLNQPTIALSNYRQIDKLYEELDLSDFIVSVNEKEFQQLLLVKINWILENYEKIKLQVCEKSDLAKFQYRDYIIKAHSWINTQFSN
jgi:polysaccharide pyruvyl transferase WcaK-like protein